MDISIEIKEIIIKINPIIIINVIIKLVKIFVIKNVSDIVL